MLLILSLCLHLIISSSSMFSTAIGNYNQYIITYTIFLGLPLYMATYLMVYLCIYSNYPNEYSTNSLHSNVGYILQVVALYIQVSSGIG